MLGETIIEQEGMALFEKEEKLRNLSKKTRASKIKKSRERLQAEIVDTVSNLSYEECVKIIHAFSVYFQLVNLVEDHHRVRVLREREEKFDALNHEKGSKKRRQLRVAESAYDLAFTLKERGLSFAEALEFFSTLQIELVFTAHPNEARRRTVLEKTFKISRILLNLETSMGMTPLEKKQLLLQMRAHVASLWQTDEVRNRDLTVMDEVKIGLYYMKEIVFPAIPVVYSRFEDALTQAYGEQAKLAPFVFFGTWRGSDRDGNPNVTPEVTLDTARLMRESILRLYDEKLFDLTDRLSQSTRVTTFSEELLKSLVEEKRMRPDVWEQIRNANENEPYRAKLTFMHDRLEETLKEGSALPRYASSKEFLSDLQLIYHSLVENRSSVIAETFVQPLIRQVETFRFEFSFMDVRQHSTQHEKIVAALLEQNNITPGYSILPEEEKVKLLSSLIQSENSVRVPEIWKDSEALGHYRVFTMIKQVQTAFSESTIKTCIVSMTSSVSDLLEVLLLMRACGLANFKENKSTLDIVPLFETIEDLRSSKSIMNSLLENEAFRKQLSLRDNLQEIMLGYSDSSKDGGYISSRWELHKAEKNLSELFAEKKVNVKFFHGRGGSVSRGGEPTIDAIRSEPQEAYSGRIKITEQGEVIPSNYSSVGLAVRHIEQITFGMAQAMLDRREGHHDNYPKWSDFMEDMSEANLARFQKLVYRTKEFREYFEKATPIRELALMKIGSRPVSRAGTIEIEDVRAIPWVFSWTQNRHLLPGWYPAGYVLDTFAKSKASGIRLLREMYDNWFFFRTVIDNLQMILIKTDMMISELYSRLEENAQVRGLIFGEIREQYELALKRILEITGQGHLLEKNVLLRHSIEVRNPYIDPMNYMQVRLLREKRDTTPRSPEVQEEILTGVKLSIVGIASGMKNTG